MSNDNRLTPERDISEDCLAEIWDVAYYPQPRQRATRTMLKCLFAKIANQQSELDSVRGELAEAVTLVVSGKELVCHMCAQLAATRRESDEWRERGNTLQSQIDFLTQQPRVSVCQELEDELGTRDVAEAVRIIKEAKRELEVAREAISNYLKFPCDECLFSNINDGLTDCDTADCIAISYALADAEHAEGGEEVRDD